MNWTDERVETLKKLWADGLSASQIAAELGGVTRNAVIGKVHRLKLSSRGRATAAAPRPKKAPGTGAKPAPRPQPIRPVAMGATALKAQFVAEAVSRPVQRTVEDLSQPESRHLKLVDLTERTCKWPNGDPLHEEFSFCGHDSAETGPYCQYHSRLAYQPVSERRRSR